MSPLWTNGNLLASGTQQELEALGGAMAENQPARIVVQALGERVGRAMLAILRDAVPTWVPDFSPGWEEVHPETWVVLYDQEGLPRHGKASEVADLFQGVVADNVNGLWVLR